MNIHDHFYSVYLSAQMSSFHAAHNLLSAVQLVETDELGNRNASIKCEYTCENDACDFRKCEEMVNAMRRINHPFSYAGHATDARRYPPGWAITSAHVVATVSKYPQILCPGLVDGFMLVHAGYNVLHMKNATARNAAEPNTTSTAVINSRMIDRRWSDPGAWNHPAVRPAD